MAERVMVFGTFDLLHPGHLYLLREATKHGEVVVSLTRDEHKKALSKRAIDNPFEKRAQQLMRLRYVTKVVASDASLNSYQIVEQERIHTVVLGHDQTALKQSLESHCRAKRLPIRIVVTPAYRRQWYGSSRLVSSAIHQ